MARNGCPQREINARARAEGRPTYDHRHQAYPLAKDAQEIFRKAEQELDRQVHPEKERLSERHREEREEFSRCRVEADTRHSHECVPRSAHRVQTAMAGPACCAARC
jgi:hypothetical protein